MYDDLAPTLVSAEPLEAVLKSLYDKGIRHALLEGGPTLAGAFVGAGLVDQVVGYHAPLLLGSGPAALSDAGIGTLADACRLRIEDIAVLGADIRITATPAAHPHSTHPHSTPQEDAPCSPA